MIEFPKPKNPDKGQNQNYKNLRAVLAAVALSVIVPESVHALDLAKNTLDPPLHSQVDPATSFEEKFNCQIKEVLGISYIENGKASRNINFQANPVNNIAGVYSIDEFDKFIKTHLHELLTAIKKREIEVHFGQNTPLIRQGYFQNESPGILIRSRVERAGTFEAHFITLIPKQVPEGQSDEKHKKGIEVLKSFLDPFK